jgi:receptor expression-enhancing protein 1/2/3/4
VLLWLLSPTTRGASLLYRSLVHPTLTAREQEIDQLLAHLAEQSYTLGIR